MGRIFYYGKFLFLILVLSMIFFFSQQNGISSGSVSNTINKCVLYCFPFMDKFDNYSLIIRKTGHVIEFLILFFATFFVLNKKLEKRSATLYSLIFTFLIAISDEFHQSFIPDRYGIIGDIYIDILIPTILSLGLLIFYFRKTPNKLWEFKNII